MPKTKIQYLARIKVLTDDKEKLKKKVKEIKQKYNEDTTAQARKILELEQELEKWKNRLGDRNLYIKELEQELERYRPSYEFTQHIQSHLKDDEFVICKICGKPLKEFEGKK